MVCRPSASPVGLNDQTPSELAVIVVAMAVPSIVELTTVLASPVPLTASFEVMWSLAELPVRLSAWSPLDRWC